MRPESPERHVRGWAFVLLVLSSIATSAGVLWLLTGLLIGGQSAVLRESDLYRQLGWFALALTLLSAALMVVSLRQFIRGENKLRSTRAMWLLVSATAIVAALLAWSLV